MRIGRHRLAARRIAVGLTQEGLAERLDVAVSTVARWEQGATAPRAWQRSRLAEVLQITLTQLDELLAPGPEPAPEPEPGPEPTAPTAWATGTGTGATLAVTASRQHGVPRVTGFVGRAEQVAVIVAALARHRAVAVVGRRGVGTSACACEAAHALASGGGGRGGRDRPPARYVDLRSSPAPHRAPAIGEALATEGALVVLDNVDDPAAVRGLLPPPEGCRLLLAGPPDLVELESVHRVAIDELSSDDAAALFEAAASRPGSGPVGARGDPRVLELVELCGRQPRAIVALAREVADGPLDLDGALEALRLAATAPPHQPVRFLLAAATVAATDVAYQALTPAARRLFRRLALVAPQALALEGMAKLAGPGRSIKHTEALVAELAHGRFVRPVPSVASAEVTEGGRYEVHPRLVPYARLHLRRDEPAWRRVRAHARLVRHLARKAGRHVARPSRPGLEWFECHERLLAGLVVVPTPVPRAVRRRWFQLAVALSRWYADEDRLDDWWAVCTAVDQVGRRRPTLWVLNERGVILRRRGDARGAIAELTKALPRRGRRGEAQVLTNRGLAFLDVDAVDAALADLERAVKGRSPRDRLGLGLTEMGLGVAYLRSGAASDARRHLVKAADAFDRARDLRGGAAARANLVLAEWETGAHNAAAEAGRVALEKYAELERLTGRADTAGVAAARRNLDAVLSSTHR